MKWMSLPVVGLVGCGAVPQGQAPSAAEQPLTQFDAIMTACPTLSRELVLGFIEVNETARQTGSTFDDQVDVLDGGPCGQDIACRKCGLAALEWVYFGLVP